MDKESWVHTTNQLHLFSMPSGRGNSVLDYDLTPRFLHDKAQKRVSLVDGVVPAPREIQIDDERYEILPAILHPEKDAPKGEGPVAIYPGTRESVIEDCLVYFARLGEFSYENGRPGYRFHGGLLGVCFTLYQLRVALADLGKEYRLDELKEGLDVLAEARYRYRNETGRQSTYGYLIANLDSIPNPNPTDKLRADRIYYAEFNPRISQLIFTGHYRRYDDRCAMSMQSPVARYLYKQLTHEWQNANTKGGAGSFRQISQNATLLAAGCPLSSNATKRKDSLIRALKELVKRDIIQPFDEGIDLMPTKSGRKVVDISVIIRPTQTFISQQIEGYKVMQDARRLGDRVSLEVNDHSNCLQAG